MTIGASGTIAQGESEFPPVRLRSWTSVTTAGATYTGSDFADALMFETTSD